MQCTSYGVLTEICTKVLHILVWTLKVNVLDKQKGTPMKRFSLPKASRIFNSNSKTVWIIIAIITNRNGLKWDYWTWLGLKVHDVISLRSLRTENQVGPFLELVLPGMRMFCWGTRCPQTPDEDIPGLTLRTEWSLRTGVLGFNGSHKDGTTAFLNFTPKLGHFTGFSRC